MTTAASGARIRISRKLAQPDGNSAGDSRVAHAPRRLSFEEDGRRVRRDRHRGERGFGLRRPTRGECASPARADRAGLATRDYEAATVQFWRFQVEPWFVGLMIVPETL